MKIKIKEFVPDGVDLTQDEIDQMEEAYQEWAMLMDEAVKSGDLDRIEEVWEMGK